MTTKNKRTIAIIAVLVIVALLAWVLVKRCRRRDRYEAAMLEDIEQRQADLNAESDAADLINTAAEHGYVNPSTARAALLETRRNPRRTLRTLEQSGAAKKLRDIRFSEASKKAILQAASQSMLAQSEQKHQDTLAPLQQANQQPQGVLSLLQ